MIGLRISSPNLQPYDRIFGPIASDDTAAGPAPEDTFGLAAPPWPQPGLPWANRNAPLPVGFELWLMVFAWIGDQLSQVARDAGELGPERFETMKRLPPGAWSMASPSPPQDENPAPEVITEPSLEDPSLVSTPNGSGKVAAFLEAALRQKGDRYVFGAETNMGDRDPSTFDCSELVEWAGHQVGVEIPDGSSNQKSHCKPISVEDALKTPGALLFRPGHVAISLGDGRTIEARGKKWGVGVFSAKDRFTSAGLVPGL